MFLLFVYLISPFRFSQFLSESPRFHFEDSFYGVNFLLLQEFCVRFKNIYSLLIVVLNAMYPGIANLRVSPVLDGKSSEVIMIPPFRVVT